MMVDGQLESAWPVTGSVLVVEDALYFTAGRTSYLDGGMLFYKLNVATGEPLHFVRLEVDPKKRDSGIASGGYLPDVLSFDGESIFLRHARFDLDLKRQKDTVPHLWSSVGFLDDSWWHRTYWQYGTSMRSGWGGWARAGQELPAGRLLVTEGSRICGFGRNQYDTPGAHVGIDADGVWGPIGRTQGRWTYYQLFAQTWNPQAGRQTRRQAADAPTDKSAWRRRIPVLGTGLVLAGNSLFVAGPLDPVSEVPHEPSTTDPMAAALESTQGGRLLVVQADNGETLADHPLPSPPVFDGMAAAGGRLYLSAKDGQVICLKAVSNE
jgi:hypothetical protein